MNLRFCFFALLASAGGFALFGCGSKGIAPPKTAPVSGSVTYKGKPIAGVRVTFHPQFDIGDIKYTCSGTTNKEGKFTLSTGGIGNGAPPGEYLVTFEWPVVESDKKSSGIEVEGDF